MAVFAIVLKSPNNSVSDRVERAYPDLFRLSPTFMLVTSNEVAQRVAEKVGVRGDSRASDASGFVVKLAQAYSGHTDLGLWDWFKEHRDDFA